MILHRGELSALQNLGRKHDGQEVDWISIPAARSLTELGLAARGRSGWTITAAGLGALSAAERSTPAVNGIDGGLGV